MLGRGVGRCGSVFGGKGEEMREGFDDESDSIKNELPVYDPKSENITEITTLSRNLVPQIPHVKI